MNLMVAWQQVPCVFGGRDTYAGQHGRPFLAPTRYILAGSIGSQWPASDIIAVLHTTCRHVGRAIPISGGQELLLNICVGKVCIGCLRRYLKAFSSLEDRMSSASLSSLNVVCVALSHTSML